MLAYLVEAKAWQERTPTSGNQKLLAQKAKLITRGGYTQPVPLGRRIHFNHHTGLKSTLAPPPPAQDARWIRPAPLTRYGVIPSYIDQLKKQVADTHSEMIHEDQGPKAADTAAASSSDAPKRLSRLDISLFITYFCNIVTLTLPVILMPLVAAEHVASSSGQALSVAAVAAGIASISTLGGGIGKVLNGFIYQKIGGNTSSTIYLIGLSLASFLLSMSSAQNARWILAAMEFAGSIQWTACNVILANHYGKTPAKMAKAITMLSLASTSGTILAKVGGAPLLKYFSWRQVAKFGGFAAMLGAITMRSMVSEKPAKANHRICSVFLRRQETKQSITQSCKAVLGNPLFWQLGIAHAMHMLMRQSDRILGVFFHQATSLSRNVCGSLTAAVTLGFVHGLMNSQRFHKLKDVTSKTKMVSQAYKTSFATSIAMALCANGWIQGFLFPSKVLLAVTVAAMSGIIASNLSFQFYQIPAMAATAFFGQNKAICLSLLDSVGFIWAAAIWGVTGKIVASAGQYGWSLIWLMLAGMFGAGGLTMMSILPSVLQKQQQQNSSP